MMNATERQQMVEDLDKFCEQHKLSFDDLLGELGYYMLECAGKEEHPVVKTLLESVGHSLRSASFDFYASTK